MTDDEFLAYLKEHSELWDEVMHILLEPHGDPDEGAASP